MPAPIGNDDADPIVANGAGGLSPSVPDVPSFSGREFVNIANITPNSQPDGILPNIEATSDYPIPAYAAWFSLDDVHEIEKRAFPEFFPSSSSSQSSVDSTTAATMSQYKHARNFMIQAWRSSTGSSPVYTSITAVRRHLAMDVAGLLKIHSFLERWGLINWIAVSISLMHRIPLLESCSSLCIPSPQNQRKKKNQN